MRTKKLFKATLIGLSLVSACKTRKVDTEILKAQSTNKVSSNERLTTKTLDSASVHKLTIGNKQVKSNGKTTIYPTPGKQFTYANGTFTGTADSITQSGTVEKSEQVSHDSNSRYSTATTSDQQKVVTAQATKTEHQKIKKTEATPIIPPGLLWILALVAAGFILWAAWQRLKKIV